MIILRNAYVCSVFRRERSDDQKYVCVSLAMVKWGVNMVVFSCYFIVAEMLTDKKVRFFEVGSCSWSTYWQLGYNRLLIMRKINKFPVYSQL